MNRQQTRSHKREGGSALVYILIAIALLGVLTSTFMDSSSQQVSSQKSVDVTVDLKSQIELIRSAIQECVLSYPKGDTSMPVDPVGGQYPVRPFPLNPTNTYLLSPAVTYNLVKSIRCPGNPGNSNNHTKIFSEASGKFMPKPPTLFDEWFYSNNSDGVYLYIGTSRADAFLDGALKKLDSQFAKCETQYINNTSNGSAVAMGANGVACPANYKCFVVKIVTTPTSVYTGETGCPS